jgi:hypothetical protein
MNKKLPLHSSLLRFLIHPLAWIKVVVWSLFFFCSLFSQYNSFAQGDSICEPSKIKKIQITGYLQAGIAATQMFGSAAATSHFSLHGVINNKYVLGLNYHLLSSVNDINKLTYPDSPENIFAIHQFAGAGFGYIFFHEKKFSLHPEMAAGWANIQYTRFDTVTVKRNYGAVMPAIYGTWNAGKIVRLGIGIHYRVLIGERFKDLTVNNLSGVAGLFFIRLGNF